MYWGRERADPSELRPSCDIKWEVAMLDRLSVLIGRVSTLSLEDLKREDGQTTVEYAVVLVLVILLATAVFTALSGSVSTAMGQIGAKITALIPSSL